MTDSSLLPDLEHATVLSVAIFARADQPSLHPVLTSRRCSPLQSMSGVCAAQPSLQSVAVDEWPWWWFALLLLAVLSVLLRGIFAFCNVFWGFLEWPEIPGDPRGFAKDMRCTVILEHPQSNCGVFGDGL